MNRDSEGDITLKIPALLPTSPLAGNSPRRKGKWVRGQLGTERLPSRILCGGYPFMPVPPPQALGWIKS